MCVFNLSYKTEMTYKEEFLFQQNQIIIASFELINQTKQHREKEKATAFIIETPTLDQENGLIVDIYYDVSSS